MCLCKKVNLIFNLLMITKFPYSIENTNNFSHSHGSDVSFSMLKHEVNYGPCIFVSEKNQSHVKHIN